MAIVSKSLVPSLAAALFKTTGVRSSSHATFVRRAALLFPNRYKDALHFYLIGIGVLPCALILALQKIFYGPCELKDYPTDGPPPHYWQYERTPIRQWFRRYFGISDIASYEQELSACEKMAILRRWRKYEERVKHLEGERWDYKAWMYTPASSGWIDHGKFVADRVFEQYEHYGHYSV